MTTFFQGPNEIDVEDHLNAYDLEWLLDWMESENRPPVAVLHYERKDGTVRRFLLESMDDEAFEAAIRTVTGIRMYGPKENGDEQ